jgi:uncharacterized membrane protein
MKKTIIISLLIAILAINIVSATNYITGTVTTNGIYPIKNTPVTVTINDNIIICTNYFDGTTTRTDKQGNYKVKLPTWVYQYPQYKITVSAKGVNKSYQTTTQMLYEPTPQTINLIPYCTLQKCQ